MERTNFEKLDVYKLSEALADDIWNVVAKWEYFAKDTVGKQIVRAADSASGRTLQKAAVAGAIKTIAALFGWRVVPYMRRFTGCVGLTKGSFFLSNKLKTLEQS